MKNMTIRGALILAATCGLAGCGGDDAANNGASPSEMDDLSAVTDTPAPYRITSDQSMGHREFAGEDHEAHALEVAFSNGTSESVISARPIESYVPSVRTAATRLIDRGTNAVRTATINARGDGFSFTGPDGAPVEVRVDAARNEILVNGRVAPGATLEQRLRNASQMFAATRVVQRTSTGQLSTLDQQLMTAPESSVPPSSRGAVWRGIKKVGSWILRNVIVPRLNPAT